MKPFFGPEADYFSSLLSTRKTGITQRQRKVVLLGGPKLTLLVVQDVDLCGQCKLSFWDYAEITLLEKSK